MDGPEAQYLSRKVVNTRVGRYWNSIKRTPEICCKPLKRRKNGKIFFGNFLTFGRDTIQQISGVLMLKIKKSQKSAHPSEHPGIKLILKKYDRER
jgi:hypothetical protein